LSLSTHLNYLPGLKSAATDNILPQTCTLTETRSSCVNTCNLQDTYKDHSSHGAGITADMKQEGE